MRRSLHLLAAVLAAGCAARWSPSPLPPPARAKRAGPVASGSAGAQLKGGPFPLREAAAHLELPPAETDLARALVALSVDVRRDLRGARFDTAAALRQIESTARDCATELADSRSGRRGRAGPGDGEVITAFLFKRLALSPELTFSGDVTHLFPDAVLARKKGSCVALSGLYLVLAQRLGVPVHGVLAPGHFFVRYDDGRARVNIETLRRGFRHADVYYRRKFRVPEGHGVYMRNLDRRETLAVFMFNVANACRDAGRADEAMRIYECVVEILPGFAEARGNLAVLDLRTGDAERAAAELNAAIRSNPCLSGAYLDLGAAYRRLGRPDEAQRVYRAGLKIAPRSAELHHALGTLLHKQGRLRRAVSSYRRAIRIRPEFARAHVNLARAYERRGKRELARRHIEKAGVSPARNAGAADETR